MTAAAMILATVLVFALAALMLWGVARFVDWQNARYELRTYGIVRDRKTGAVTYVNR